MMLLEADGNDFGSAKAQVGGLFDYVTMWVLISCLISNTVADYLHIVTVYRVTGHGAHEVLDADVTGGEADREFEVPKTVDDTYVTQLSIILHFDAICRTSKKP